MFSLTNHQQILGPLSTLASLINCSRAASVGNVTHRQGKSIRARTKESITQDDINRAVECLESMGIDDLASVANVVGVKTSISSPSTVYKESSLESLAEYGLKNGELENSLLHDPSSEKAWSSLVPLSYNLVQPWFKRNIGPSTVFARGFKTKRSSTGLGGASKTGEPESQSLKVSIFDTKVKQTDRFRSMLSELDGAPLLQEKLKVAFAEGYSAYEKKNPDGKSTLYSKVVKAFLYAIAFWCVIQLIQLFSTVGGSMRGLGVLNREQYEVNPEEITVCFDDVKGVDEAKSELKDVVEFLKDPDRFTGLGAKLPKGVLLVGPPGIGKTLLARAVAGEAGVPFFHASGSEFDEIFVGTGAKRVRQLFGAAKIRAPCVIFIDEIDTVGAKRTSSQIHPYANQTINQLLSEMDGFQQNEGVIVLGATNRRDNLDKALLRPGRFDVEVRVFPPDLKGRKDIIQLYLNKVKYDNSVDIDQLARGTSGFTGADIENLVNQAALKAAMDGHSTVNMTHIDHAKDKVIMGPAKKTRIPDEETNLLTAYHEAGHTVVAYYSKDATALHKVTIIPRGMSLGHTSFVPEKEEYNKTKSQLMAQMDVAMGGRVAEELVYGQDKVTTGAASDFQQATAIATAMVKKYGMSEKVGVRMFGEEAVDSGLSMLKVNDLSPATTELVDSEIKRLLQESYERARTILKTHASAHKALAKALMKYETLDTDEIKTVLEGRKLKPVKTESL